MSPRIGGTHPNSRRPKAPSIRARVPEALVAPLVERWGCSEAEAVRRAVEVAATPCLRLPGCALPYDHVGD